MDDQTRQLTRAIASGDREAFARFYREWFGRVYATAKGATRRDEAFCLDVTQDAFVKMIRAMKAISTQAELAAWVRRVVLSSAYDRLRREKRMRVREARPAPLEIGDAVPVGDVERLRKELAALDPTTAWMIDARYRLGWTLERIGRIAGMKTGAVDGRVRRGVAQLGEAMGRGDE